MRALTRSLPILAISFLTSSALAQTAPAPASMDRFAETTSGGARATYLAVDGDGYGLRFDVGGQYIAPAGYGGYLTVPYSLADDGTDSQSATGNVELGGLYVLRTANMPVILRAGIVVSTIDDQDAAAVQSNFAGALIRWTDAPQHIPSSTWLRLSAHPLYTSGNLFGRADIGLDIPIADDIEGGSIDDKFFRANFAGGIVTGNLAVMGELVNNYNLNGDVDNQLVNFLGASVRHLGAGGLQPYAGIQLPLDEDFNDFIDFAFIVGLDFVQPSTGVATATSSDAPPPPPMP